MMFKTKHARFYHGCGLVVVDEVGKHACIGDVGQWSVRMAMGW